MKKRLMIAVLGALAVAGGPAGCESDPATAPVVEPCETVTEVVEARLTIDGDPHGVGSRRLAFLRDVVGADCERVGTEVRTHFDNGALLSVLLGVWECTRCRVGGEP